MPLDVSGLHARYTDAIQRVFNFAWKDGVIFDVHRDGDSFLQLLISSEELFASATHQLVLITSQPFVHTARRSYR